MKRFPLFFFLASWMLYAVPPSDDNHVPGKEGISSNYFTVREDVKNALRNGKATGKTTKTGIAIFDGSDTIIASNIGGFNKYADRNEPAQGYKSGVDFLNSLSSYGNRQCMRMVSVILHGWSESRLYGGEGIGVATSDLSGIGFYLDQATADNEAVRDTYTPEYEKQFDEKYRKVNAKLIAAMPEDQIKARIAKKLADARANKIKESRILSRTVDDIPGAMKEKGASFCNSCVIQIYACNIGDAFAEKLMATTGCQVVYSTGNMTGVDTNSGALDHKWISDQKDWKDEKGVVHHSPRPGSLFALTPVKDGKKIISRTKDRILTSPKAPYDSRELWPL